MSFFKHVKLHEYDITDSGITSACYDELVADGNNSDPKQLEILARAMCEEFKDYMRPLFSQLTSGMYSLGIPETLIKLGKQVSISQTSAKEL